MQIDRCGRWAVLFMVGYAAGCAGNGEGHAGGGAGGLITADFQSIQDNVFTPICSKCHIGASAPEGLQLDAAHSYNLLVGVPSAEQPNLLRVKPGDSDNSYMAHKIEGLAGIVGGQMPLGETPLPQATIAAIRQWITDGAPNAPAAAAASAQIFAVQTTAPLDGATIEGAPVRLVVTFTQDLDASLVNGSTVTLERIRDEGGSDPVAVVCAAAPSNPAVLLITPRKALAPGLYRATLRGTGGGALANLNAIALGADISFDFTVEPAP